MLTLLPFVLAYRLPANVDASGISPWGESPKQGRGGETRQGPACLTSPDSRGTVV